MTTAGLRVGQRRGEFAAHMKEIEALYEISGIQNVAVNAYINSIIAGGLRFAGSKEPVSGMLLSAVVDMIRNLCLFGFTAYRILSVDAEVGSDDLAIQVPSGTEVSVRFSQSRMKWVPDIAQSDDAAADAMDMSLFTVGEAAESDDEDPDGDPNGWKCIVWMPPTETRLCSFAAQSQQDALRIEEIYKNIATRDAFNSRPACYTVVNESELSARGRAGGQPFLRSSLDVDATSGTEGMTRGMDYQELLATRAAVLRGLADSTDRTDHASEAAGSSYDRTGVGLRGDMLFPEREAFHRELSITEGRKATPVPSLQAQDHIDRFIIRLRLNVLESFGVAPQFVGESVSAERVGSNAQSTTNAMRMFELRARTLRDTLPVDLLGIEWINRPPINLFERVYPILKAEAAVEMAAAVYRIDPDILDVDRIKRQQDAMLGDKKDSPTAPGNAPEALKGEKRKRKTEMEKEVTDLNKGETI